MPRARRVEEAPAGRAVLAAVVVCSVFRGRPRLGVANGNAGTGGGG